MEEVIIFLALVLSVSSREVERWRSKVRERELIDIKDTISKYTDRLERENSQLRRDRDIARASDFARGVSLQRLRGRLALFENATTATNPGGARR